MRLPRFLTRKERPQLDDEAFKNTGEQIAAHLNTLIERLGAGNFGAAKQLLAEGEYARLQDNIASYKLGENYGKILEEAYILAQNLRQYEIAMPQLQQLLAAVTAAEDADSMYTAYVNFYDSIMRVNGFIRDRFCSENEMRGDDDSLTARLHECVLDYRNVLSARIQDEDSLRIFDSFMVEWAEESIPGLSYPDNWNYLVATLVVAPEFTLFIDTETEEDNRNGYQLSLQAAQAWNTNDIEGIMIALARCEKSSMDRTELGPMYLELCLAANRLRPHLQIPRY